MIDEYRVISREVELDCVRQIPSSFRHHHFSERELRAAAD
jgi:hypothetical protein